MLQTLKAKLPILIFAITVLTAVVAIFLLIIDSNSEGEEILIEHIESRRPQDQFIIDSLIVEQGIMLREIDSLQKVKQALGYEYTKLKKKLATYKKVRYYHDADFDTESQRIARSSYRYDTPDGNTSKREGIDDRQDNSERRSPF